MELQHVQRVDLQVLQRLLDEAGDGLDRVALGDMGVELAAGFRRDNDVFLSTARFQHLGNEFLGTAHAVDIGGVEEVDAAVERRVQRGFRVAVRDLTPIRADRPGAETDRIDLPAGAAEGAMLHGVLL